MLLHRGPGELEKHWEGKTEESPVVFNKVQLVSLELAVQVIGNCNRKIRNERLKEKLELR